MADAKFEVYTADGRIHLSDRWGTYSIQGKVSGTMTRASVAVPYFSAAIDPSHVSRPLAIRCGAPAAVGHFFGYSIIAWAGGSGLLSMPFDYFLVGVDPVASSPMGLQLFNEAGNLTFDISSLPVRMAGAGWGTTNKAFLDAGGTATITTGAGPGDYAVWNTSPVYYMSEIGGVVYKVVLGAQATGSGDVITLGIRRNTDPAANTFVNAAENHAVSVILFDVAGL